MNTPLPKNFSSVRPPLLLLPSSFPPRLALVQFLLSSPSRPPLVVVSHSSLVFNFALLLVLLPLIPLCCRLPCACEVRAEMRLVARRLKALVAKGGRVPQNMQKLQRFCICSRLALQLALCRSTPRSPSPFALSSFACPLVVSLSSCFRRGSNGD